MWLPLKPEQGWSGEEGILHSGRCPTRFCPKHPQEHEEGEWKAYTSSGTRSLFLLP